MRALPLVLAPLPDETWHSYLTRAAAGHGVSTAELADHLGLRDRGRWPSFYGTFLDAGTGADVADRLGLDPGQVQAMQLSRYDGTVFDLSELRTYPGLDGARRTAAIAWVFLAGTRYCPTCLDRDRGWRLSWRIPWLTACPTHRIALEWRCPTCGGTPGVYGRDHGSVPRRSPLLAEGHRCDLPIGAGHCGADLSLVQPRPATTAQLAWADLLASMIDTGQGSFAGQGGPSLEVLRAYQSAIGIAMHLKVVDPAGWGRTHRWTSPPRDPAVMDTLLATVQPVAQAPDPDQAATVVAGWCQTVQLTPHADTFNRSTQPSTLMAPVLDEVLRRHGRASTQVRRIAEQGRLPLTDWTVHDIPQVAWPCALPERLRSSRKPDALLLQAVVSLLVARMATGGTWLDAGAALGIPSEKARNWPRYAVTKRFGIQDDLVAAATRLASRLADQPTHGYWHRRPDIDPTAHGITSLTEAQRPACRRDDPTSRWCPCTATPAG